MKWKIESVIHNDDPTITVRIAILNDKGEILFHDQNSIADQATEEQIVALCDEMAAKHDKPEKKDFSHLIGLES